MIHIRRSSKPKALSSPQIKRWKVLLKDFYVKPESERTQNKPPFRIPEMVRLLKQDLQNLFEGKCAYCESRVSASAPTILDHFRPKFNAVDLDGTRSADYYWWLADEWFNLYLACQSCNTMKGSRFPVKGERSKPNSTESEVRMENAMLLDPCFDYPRR